MINENSLKNLKSRRTEIAWEAEDNVGNYEAFIDCCRRFHAIDHRINRIENPVTPTDVLYTDYTLISYQQLNK